jgi:hypothetical protein
MDEVGPLSKPPHPATGSSPPERSNEWGKNTSPVVAFALIPICYVVLLARLIWPEQLTHGAVDYLFGLFFIAAGIESLLEIISGFVWGPPARYVRGALLGIAALLYSFLPT